MNQSDENLSEQEANAWLAAKKMKD